MNKPNHTPAELVAKMLLEIGAVTLSPKVPYKFTSGMLSPIYTDNRLLMGYPFKRKEVTIYMAGLLKENGLDPQIIAGTSTAGIPPAAWLAEILNLPMIYVRSEKKHHGKGKQIEGIMNPGTNVLLVEDLISTGKSSLGAIDAIREEGGSIDTCVAFFDYELPGVKNKYAERKINLYTLTTTNILLDCAIKMKLINEEEKNLVLEWQKNPQAWEEKVKASEPQEVETSFK